MILKEFDQNTARLIPNIIKMESELELSTYTIYEWDLVHFEEGKSVKCKGHGRVMFFLQMMTIKVYTINMILQRIILIISLKMLFCNEVNFCIIIKSVKMEAHLITNSPRYKDGSQV